MKRILLLFGTLLCFMAWGSHAQRPQQQIMLGNPGSAASNPLNTSLVGCWNLGEASGNALDSSGNSLTLTDHGSVGQAAGIGGAGNSRSFNGTTQYFSRASSASLQFPDSDWTYVIWMYLASDTTAIMSGKDDGGANREFILGYNAGSNETYSYIWSGGTPTPVEETATININTWYMVAVQYDATANIFSISTNAGTAQTTSVGPLDAPGTAAFEVGAFQSGSTPWTGRLQYAAKWSRKLSGVELTSLYNAGAGLSCTY